MAKNTDNTPVPPNPATAADSVQTDDNTRSARRTRGNRDSDRTDTRTAAERDAARHGVNYLEEQNAVLGVGQVGVGADGTAKVGDGVTGFNDLPSAGMKTNPPSTDGLTEDARRERDEADRARAEQVDEARDANEEAVAKRDDKS